MAQSIHQIKATATVVDKIPTDDMAVGFYKVVYPNGNYGGVFRVLTYYTEAKFVMEWS